MFLQMFAPESWSPVERFAELVGPPFVHREVGKGTSAARAHLAKVEVVGGLVNRLVPLLAEDSAELERDGYTQAIRSRELAALLELQFLELYSVLDGVRRTIFGAFSSVRGVQNKSNEQLFRRAAEGKYGAELPAVITTALAEAYATWFPELRRIRTEVTHGDVGFASLDAASGRIQYLHPGLGASARALVIDDVLAKVSGFAASVTATTEIVYSHLYGMLGHTGRKVVCGFYHGRVYERTVSPAAGLSFHTGRCESRQWFEAEPDQACPMRVRCGAYAGGKAIEA